MASGFPNPEEHLLKLAALGIEPLYFNQVSSQHDREILKLFF
jgi:hypothetical protein